MEGFNRCRRRLGKDMGLEQEEKEQKEVMSNVKCRGQREKDGVAKARGRIKGGGGVAY